MKLSFSIFTLLLVAGTYTATAQGIEQKNNEKEAKAAQGCGFLGVYPTNVSASEATTFGLPERRGAVVDGVVDGTPAKVSGILDNDVIVGWNGQRVEAEPQFRKMVLGTQPGSTVTIDLFRNGQPMQVTVQALGTRGGCGCVERSREIDPRLGEELGRAEQQIREAERRVTIAERRIRESLALPGFTMVAEQGRLGATVQNISPQLGKYFGVDNASGALVSSVAENSAGARGGLQAGDVILAVDGVKIGDPRALIDATRTKEGKVNILVIRDRREMTITVDLGSRPVSPTTPVAPQTPAAPPELGSLLDGALGTPMLGMQGR